MKFQFGPSVTHKNLQKLVAEMITRAVLDYREFSERGLIVNGKSTCASHVRAYGVGSHRLVSAEIKQLIHFFAGETMEHWIDMADLNLTAASIRCKLGILKTV
jgi:hypothetical protein